VDENNKILTEYTYMAAYKRREGRAEQRKRFEEAYEVIEQVDVPVDIGRLLRCAVSNDAWPIAEYLIHRDRNCVRWRDVLGRSPLVYAAALPWEKMLKLLSAQLEGKCKPTFPPTSVSIAGVRVSIRRSDQEHQNSGLFFKFNLLYKELL
jgi:hypothetical protein